jgi:hypothetical protein
MKLNPFPAIKRGCDALIAWVHAAVCALTTEDGRKGWAMLAALGCSFVMTGYAAASLWLVRKSPMLAFWLGLAGLVIVTVVITGLMVLLGIRRETDIDLKEGKVRLNDFDQEPVVEVNTKTTTTVTPGPSTDPSA